MSFLENISRFVVGEEAFVCDYRYCVYGTSGGYFEGVTGVEFYSKRRIELQIKGGKIVVMGDNLYIAKLCRSDVAIKGEIKNVEVVI